MATPPRLALSPTMKAAWVLALAIGLVDLAWMLVAGIGVSPKTAAIRLGAAIGLLALKWYYDRRGERGISALVHVTAYLIVFSAVAALLSYLSASFWLTLEDAALIRADHLLGLDWLAYERLVGAVPHLFQLYSFVYFTSLPQIIVMLIWLNWLKRTDRAEGLGFDLAFACFTCIVISTLVPALGTYVSLDPANSAMAFHADDAQAMRAGTLKIIDLGNVQGLITFPSYHVVISLCLVWAARGIRFLFPIVLVLNVLIILATPIIGGHYFVDLLAGLAVWAAILAVRHYLVEGRPALPAARLETSKI